MKRSITFTIILCLIILLTGCSSNSLTSIKKVNKDKTLICSGTYTWKNVKTKSNIKLKFKKNKLYSGYFIVKLILPKNSSKEDKEMLNNISLCSTDNMGELINLGKCSTNITNNILESKLTIKKSMLNNYNKNINKIKNIIEKNYNRKCTIK